MILASFLDQLYRDYHHEDYLSSDPLEFVHRYRDPLDQEAVALLAALLAYGNVKQIRRSVEDVLERITRASGSPRAFVENPVPAALKGFVHRFNVGEDLVLLLRLLGRSWREHGSLGAHFALGLDADAADFGEALDTLITEWRRWARELCRGKVPGTFNYLLTAPADGSCCKRWCMFLRWMGRCDGLDIGLWVDKGLRPDQLVIPLDTHTGRISQYLGLTSRKSLGWKAALEVTAALRAASPGDPVRYDFALARLGILDLCQRKYRAEICEKCQLRPVCRFARQGERASSRRKAREAK